MKTVTTAINLSQRVRKDNTSALRMRVTINGRADYIPLGQYVRKNHFDSISGRVVVPGEGGFGRGGSAGVCRANVREAAHPGQRGPGEFGQLAVDDDGIHPASGPVGRELGDANGCAEGEKE